MRICLIAEGCYPYVAGGVSSWIQMLIQGMPEHTFVICTIAASEEQKGQFKYQLPENVEQVQENFLDQSMDGTIKRKGSPPLAPEERQALLDLMTGGQPDWDVLFEMFSQGGRRNANEFLSSSQFLDVVMEACQDAYRLTPFNQVFWTVRSMLLPVLNILSCPVPQVDVFHSVSTGYAGILGAMFKQKTGKPLLVTEHGIYCREREEEILKAKWADVYFKQTWIGFFLGMARWAYDQADRIISLFGRARELQISYGADPKRCQVIPNGIQLKRFAAVSPLPAVSEELVLGAVVRVVPIKDIKTMIYSFALVKQKIHRSRLYIIGPEDEDVEYLEECRDLIRNLNLDGVEFTGRVDVSAWYGKIDLLLLSSISEGQPFVILEAMASRRPVVATDVGSCRELLEGAQDDLGAAGEVVPVMSPDRMAKAVIRLGRDRQRMRQMGSIGLERAKKYYREEDFLEAYRNLYKEVSSQWQV